MCANSADPDQTPRSAASDLGLYCLPMSMPHFKGCWVIFFSLIQIVIEHSVCKQWICTVKGHKTYMV